MFFYGTGSYIVDNYQCFYVLMIFILYKALCVLNFSLCMHSKQNAIYVFPNHISCSYAQTTIKLVILSKID